MARFRCVIGGFLLASVLAAAPFASVNPRVVLDGRELSFDMPPVIQEGRALVPLRGIFEALGAEVHWDGDTRTVTAVRDGTVVTLTIGVKTAYKDLTAIELDVPAKIVNGRTMVPLRFVSESLGAGVERDEESRSVLIAAPEPDEDPFAGCLGEEDVLTLWLSPGESRGRVVDSELGTETWFFFVGPAVGETLQVDDCLYEYAVPDLGWRSQAEALLPAATDVVRSGLRIPERDVGGCEGQVRQFWVFQEG